MKPLPTNVPLFKHQVKHCTCGHPDCAVIEKYANRFLQVYTGNNLTDVLLGLNYAIGYLIAEQAATHNQDILDQALSASEKLIKQATLIELLEFKKRREQNNANKS